MPDIRVSESRTIPAAAAVLYDTIADYRSGHPRILPTKYFTSLEVLRGGYGAGTQIRFSMRAFGRTTVETGDITEPVPGRELRETLASGVVTTFVVEPQSQSEATVTITTEYSRGGVRGWLERLLVPGYLRRVYASELAQLARVATAAQRVDRGAPGEG